MLKVFDQRAFNNYLKMEKDLVGLSKQSQVFRYEFLVYLSIEQIAMLSLLSQRFSRAVDCNRERKANLEGHLISATQEQLGITNA